MKRITTWITATLVVVALATGYQVSRSGDDAQRAAPASAQTGGTQGEHTGKPGESK